MSWPHLTGKHPDAVSYQNAPTALQLVFDTDPWLQGGHGRPGNEAAVAVEALLDKGANPNVRNKEGEPVLIIAAGFGYANNVRSLLAQGAEVNV